MCVRVRRLPSHSRHNNRIPPACPAESLIAARASLVPPSARTRQFERARLAGAGAYRKRRAAALRAGRPLEVDRRLLPVAHGTDLAEAAVARQGAASWREREEGVDRIVQPKRTSSNTIQADTVAPMASPVDCSRVSSLCDSALAFERKGFFPRAAAMYDQAVQAALALAQPDCLVVVSVQLMCVNALTYVASDAESVAERMEAAGQLMNLQDDAIDTLQRRLAQGTVMPGRCRAYEVAWYDVFNASLSGHGGIPPSAAGKAEWATRVGSDSLLRAGNNVLQEVLSSQQAGGGLDPDVQKRCALVVSALDALAHFAAEGRAKAEAGAPGACLWTVTQSTLVASMLQATAQGALRPGTRVGGALLTAWGRVEATGFLRAMGGPAEAHADSAVRLIAQREAARAKAAKAPQCRACALPSCDKNEAHPGHFKVCSACKGAAYCTLAARSTRRRIGAITRLRARLRAAERLDGILKTRLVRLRGLAHVFWHLGVSTPATLRQPMRNHRGAISRLCGDALDGHHRGGSQEGLLR